MKKLMTLCYIINDDKVLLGMKKRGFGVGRWNGFGGKVNENESVEEAAVREMKEECDVDIKKLKESGILEFRFIDKEDVLEVHLFKIFEEINEPIESEEMKPQWFAFKEIPYSEMWDDDQYWLAEFLKGKNVDGKFMFDENDKVISKEIFVS
jgi:8-oxo-dGTP diphosphatase / 2-hydroxy-dATP diphosphatase